MAPAEASTPAPSICPALLYRDPKAAIEQLTTAFGFTKAVAYEDEAGNVLHAELSYGNGTVMVGPQGREGVYATAMAGAGPTGLYVVVDDPDAHFRRAEAAGVEILMPPTDQEGYDSRDYMARDAEGNVWCFGTYAPALKPG